MNAPLPESVRRALETVSLEDNLRSRLQHNDTAGGAAGRRGFGFELAGEGGAV